MAIDESTTIKNPKAKRTKYFESATLDYRRIMTGSPVTRNPLDLYHSVVLDPNFRFYVLLCFLEIDMQK